MSIGSTTSLPPQAVGRRKEASARVRLRTGGTGVFVVNGKPYREYFTTDALRRTCIAALEAAGQLDKLDIEARVVGGGVRGQADAVRLGTARALCTLNPTFHRALRKVGLLTRDPRVKERKKPGLKRARKAPQWAKR